MFFWFENDEPQNVERSLGMPAEEDPINADQENALQMLGVLGLSPCKPGM
jgi:hypothetical protein